MQRIAAGLYLHHSTRPANAYLIEGPSDLTLLDAGYARSADALVDELRDNGFDFKEVARVVLTHAHGDHAGGVPELSRRRRFKVYAHPAEVPTLEGRAPGKGRLRGALGFLHGWGAGEPIESVIALEPGMPVRGLSQWQVVHSPGHTPGSLSLFHPAGQILLCGDALSNRGGRLHLPRNWDDEAAARGSAKSLAALDCDILCCGHGPVVRGGAFRFIESLLR